MRKTVVKLSVVFSLFVLLSCIFTVTAYADEASTLSDGGYYTISNIDASGYLSVSAEGVASFAGDMSQYTLFELGITQDGKYTMRSLAASGGQYLSSVPDEQGRYLCADPTLSQTHFVISEQDGAYSVSTVWDSSVYMGVVAGEGGYTLSFGESGNRWSITEYIPQSMSLSLYSITTRPYTAYIDLRAVITPSYLAEYVEWTSSDRSVAIVDDDGLFCALSEGKAQLTAALGNYTLSCDVKVTEEASYAWFSQNNISTGGWNGDALAALRFSSGGVTKRFAANNSSKKTDWMSEGCAICSIAQVLNNMGARYTDGYDLRSGMKGNVIADPYTVSLANVGHKGPESANTTLWGDPVLTRHTYIASGFNVDGKRVSVQQKYSVTKLAIKEALDKCPWGVVVCFENAAYGPHYITFNKCLNPDAKNPNDYIFTVSDPASTDPSNSADIIFEKSYSYVRLRYRFYNAKLMQIWSYEQ